MRASQTGLTQEDLDELTVGMVLDMFTESANDSYDYAYLATQEDFDRWRQNPRGKADAAGVCVE